MKKGLNTISFILIIFVLQISSAIGDQIIQSTNGDYYILKNDGTFKKLPKPKEGFTYKIKKKEIQNDTNKNSIFKRIEKKSRQKTNSSIR